MNCPSKQELLQLAEGEVAVSRAPVLEAHLAGCQRCAGELRAARVLLADVAASGVKADDEDFVARVVRHTQAARPPAWRPRPVVWAFVAAAAVIALVPTVAWLGRRSNDGPGETFGARGGGARPTLGNRVEIEVLVVRDRTTRPITGVALHPTDRLAVRYTAVAPERPVFLLVFALDAAGDVHWLHPAYPDETQDPPAIPLRSGARKELLGEVVQLEKPAPGALRVVAVVSYRQRTVKQVESLLRGAGPATPVAPRFVSDLVSEWTVVEEVAP